MNQSVNPAGDFQSGDGFAHGVEVNGGDAANQQFFGLLRAPSDAEPFDLTSCFGLINKLDLFLGQVHRKDWRKNAPLICNGERLET